MTIPNYMIYTPDITKCPFQKLIDTFLNGNGLVELSKVKDHDILLTPPQIPYHEIPLNEFCETKE